MKTVLITGKLIQRRAMRQFPINAYGLTKSAHRGTLSNGHDLRRQLKEAGVPTTETTLRQIFGQGGCAALLNYHSPKSDLPVTVLLIPHQAEDDYGEDYFYFADMTQTEADRLNWVDQYDACRRLENEPAAAAVQCQAGE